MNAVDGHEHVAQAEGGACSVLFELQTLEGCLTSLAAFLTIPMLASGSAVEPHIPVPAAVHHTCDMTRRNTKSCSVHIYCVFTPASS